MRTPRISRSIKCHKLPTFCTGADSFGVFKTLEEAKLEVRRFLEPEIIGTKLEWKDEFDGRQITLEGQHYGIENVVIYQIQIGEMYWS
jgi:hypothetical protein